MDKGAFMGDVECSPICQYGEESHPPVHSVVGWDMSFPAVDFAVTYKPAPTPLGHGTEAPPWRALSQKIPQRWESLCGNPGFQWRSSSTLLEKNKQTKKHRIRCTGEGKRYILPLPTSALPQGGTAQGQERSSQPVISPMGEEWEHVSECPASPVMQDIAKEAHFYVTP